MDGYRQIDRQTDRQIYIVGRIRMLAMIQADIRRGRSRSVLYCIGCLLS